MDIENYNNIFTYLKNNQIPSHFNNTQKQQLKNQTKHFIIKNNFLYKIDKRKTNNYLRVI